jgi:chromosome segregation ATPase
MLKIHMLRAPLIIFIILVFVISAFSAVYQISKLNLNLREARVLNTQLNGQLTQILQEKEKLKEQLSQAKEELINLRLSLEEKEKAINQMSDAQVLREALISAQERIKQLNENLSQIKNEKATLEGANLNMSNRLKNTTQELIRAIEELRLSQNQLKDMERSQVLPLKEKIEELNKLGEKKDEELNKLEEELAELEESKAALVKREERIKYLESELAKRDDYQSSAIYASATGQVKRLSEILVNKELELDRERAESSDLKDKLNSMQARISELEDSLDRSQLEQSDIKKLEAEKLSLEYRLREMQVEYAEKADLIDTLQSSLESINQELRSQEERNKLITVRLAQADISKAQAEEKFTQQLERLQEVSLLYDELKNQIGQISEVLTEKELELSRRQEEVSFLREEIDILNSRSAKMDRELAEAKERQRRTMDDLVAAISLNKDLQERLAGGAPASPEPRLSGYGDIDEKREAEEFRRKIEVFLEPEE